MARGEEKQQGLFGGGLCREAAAGLGGRLEGAGLGLGLDKQAVFPGWVLSAAGEKAAVRVPVGLGWANLARLDPQHKWLRTVRKQVSGAWMFFPYPKSVMQERPIFAWS